MALPDFTTQDATPYKTNIDAAFDDIFNNGMAFAGANYSFGNAVGGNAGIEIGDTSGVATTSYVDLHSGATVVDFDARLSCAGGNGSSGYGTIDLMGGVVRLTDKLGTSQVIVNYNGNTIVKAAPNQDIDLQTSGTGGVTTSGDMVVGNDLAILGQASAAGGFLGDIIGNADTASKVVESGASTNMNMKVIDIGDWNMDTTVSVDVSHGLGANFSKIRAIQALIRNDAGSTFYDLATTRTEAETTGTVISCSTSLITLYRGTGGFFDSTSFDSTSFNRGWITIWYTD